MVPRALPVLGNNEINNWKEKKIMNTKISEDLYDSFKVKKDNKIRRKERRQNNDYRNWSTEDVEDWEEEDEKDDKY